MSEGVSYYDEPDEFGRLPQPIQGGSVKDQTRERLRAARIVYEDEPGLPSLTRLLRAVGRRDQGGGREVEARRFRCSVTTRSRRCRRLPPASPATGESALDIAPGHITTACAYPMHPSLGVCGRPLRAHPKVGHDYVPPATGEGAT